MYVQTISPSQAGSGSVETRVGVIRFPQASLTVGVVGATASAGQSTVLASLAGVVKSGMSMVIDCVTKTEFPQSSEMLYVLIIVPSHEIELGTSLTNATIGLTVQLSASSVTTVISAAGTSPIHSTVTGAGLEAVGLVVSSTVIVWVTVIVFPQSSVME